MSETDLEMDLKAWRLLLEDDAYRLDFPEDYYDALIRRADELVLHDLISPQDWQLLKDAADQAFQLTVEMLARNHRDCLNLASLCLLGEEGTGERKESTGSSTLVQRMKKCAAKARCEGGIASANQAQMNSEMHGARDAIVTSELAGFRRWVLDQLTG